VFLRKREHGVIWCFATLGSCFRKSSSDSRMAASSQRGIIAPDEAFPSMTSAMKVGPVWS